jgi:hypothetical protein
LKVAESVLSAEQWSACGATVLKRPSRSDTDTQHLLSTQHLSFLKNAKSLPTMRYQIGICPITPIWFTLGGFSRARSDSKPEQYPVVAPPASGYGLNFLKVVMRRETGEEVDPCSQH